MFVVSHMSAYLPCVYLLKPPASEHTSCQLCPARETNAGWKFLYISQIRDVRKGEVLCWAQLKRYIKKHNKKFTLSAMRDLTYEGFWKVGP